MNTFIFPWYLFKKPKKEILTDDKISEIHSSIQNEVTSMINNNVSSRSIESFINNINKMMRNKWGKKWIDFKIKSIL
jgi:hypothetical protein